MVIIGIIIIGFAIYTAISPKEVMTLNFLDTTSLIFVGCGIIGVLLISLDLKQINMFFKSLSRLTGGASKVREKIESELILLFNYWNDKDKSRVLEILKDTKDPFIETAAETLIMQADSDHTRARFELLRNKYVSENLPVIDTWELIAKTAPVFGMVGTVMGLFRMFQAFSMNSDLNLGSAMALALLTTLYGILIGYGIATPIANRLEFQINKDLNLISVAESAVLVLQKGDLPDSMKISKIEDIEKTAENTKEHKNA